MIEREERVGLIVYLYYNRDAKKLANFGDIIYHSKKHRYLQLYVAKDQADYLNLYVKQEEAQNLQENLPKERYVKQVRISHIKELDQNFVGSLYREQENVII